MALPSASRHSFALVLQQRFPAFVSAVHCSGAFKTIAFVQVHKFATSCIGGLSQVQQYYCPVVGGRWWLVGGRW